MTISVPALGVTGTGPTLADYVEALGEQLGTYVEHTVSAVGSGGEAARHVYLSEMIDDEEGRARFGGYYCYAKSGAQAGNQRRILQEGYEGPLGALVLSRKWAAALAQGTTVALTEPLPVREHLGVKGLRDLVNEALARIWIDARISFTGNGTYQTDLSSYPWLRSVEQTRGIYDSLWAASGEAPALSQQDYRFDVNGAARTLVTDEAYTTADTFYLAALVRGDTLIYDGASWAYTATPGLINDTDQGAAPIHHVVALGMVKGLRYLMRQARSDARLSAAEKRETIADLADRLRPWKTAASRIILEEFPKPIQAPSGGFFGVADDMASAPTWT